jgi:hypothetical protein
MTTAGAFLFSNSIGLRKVKAPVVWRARASATGAFGWQRVDCRTRSAGNHPNWHASRTYAGSNKFAAIPLN